MFVIVRVFLGDKVNESEKSCFPLLSSFDEYPN